MTLIAPPAIELPVPSPIRSVTLTPAEMFKVADIALRRNDAATASTIYQALSTNPAKAVRNEARFRLAMLLSGQHRYSAAAVLLRSILDEQPDAQRVRLELAAILAKLGDEAGARQQLRTIRTGSLPPDVVRMVDRFSDALRARKPAGASLRIALASDSNVNRATRSDTLGTVIGDFNLDKDAKAQSGRGVAVDGQVYGRLPLGRQADLLATVSTAATLYRKRRFDDVTLGIALGPEFQLGKYRLHASGGTSRRWFGQKPFADIVSVRADAERPLGSTAALRTIGSVSHVRHRLNRGESGYSYAGSVQLEKALSSTSGMSFSVSAIRQALAVPAYSTKSGELSLLGYREFGRLTLSASASAGRLVADRRLAFFPTRRKDWSFRGTLGATARHIVVSGFAPTMQLTFERNKSPIEIYDYKRTAFEVGVVRAF